MNVTDHEIEDAALEGARTYLELQERTKLGTVCGNCKDEATELLDKYIKTTSLSKKTNLNQNKHTKNIFIDNITEPMIGEDPDGTRYNIQPATDPASIHMMEYMYRECTGLESDTSAKYIIYADQDKNLYEVYDTSNYNGGPVASGHIVASGLDISINGSALGSSVQAFAGLSTSIQNNATISFYKSNVFAKGKDNDNQVLSCEHI
jgi:bacterioferritin-associated ferredoxin